jgi:RHS repeat-associated protein
MALRRSRITLWTTRLLLAALTTTLAPPPPAAAMRVSAPIGPYRPSRDDLGSLHALAAGLHEGARLAALPLALTLAALEAANTSSTPPAPRATRRPVVSHAHASSEAAPEPAPPASAPLPAAIALALASAQANAALGASQHGLRAAALPWAAASTEALLDALAAPEPGPEAPGLVRQHTFPAGWRLISVPLVAANTAASAVLAGLPAPRRAYDYVAGQTVGLGEPGFRSVVPGRAFWLYTRQPVALSLEGAPVNVAVEQRLPLQPGWNLVATPWLSAVEWSDTRVSVRQGSETVALGEAITRGWIETELTHYDPATDSFLAFAANTAPAGMLRPWAGALVFSHVVAELVLAPPPADTLPPTLAIDPAPVDGQEITAPTEIRGSVDDESLAEWRLELAPVGTSLYTTFAQGSTPVSNGVLGVLDPTQLENGQYEVRFVATDLTGRSTSLSWSVTVKGELKIGNFSLAFVDLAVPLAGLPIEVKRTYDSRDKGRGDFGIGWRLELSRIKVDENMAMGADWSATRSGGLFPTYCVEPSRPHRVSVRLPDGRLLEFEPSVTPQCQQIIPPQFVALGFRALPGTLGTLEALDVGGDLLVPGPWPGATDLLDIDTGEPADPNLYRLTLPDGRAFVVHQQNGLQRLADANGNELVVSSAGILHSSGTGVAFTRDALGRITRITDPAGNFMTYGYDAAGDLTSYTDREGQTTTYAYNSSHGLTSITDPLGRQPIRNDYDATGRLIRHTDAFGKTVEYTHDVSGRQEIVLDRLGRARLVEYDERGNVVRTVDEAGNVNTRSFDARNNLLSETDAFGATSTMVYDAANNATRASDPLGGVGQYTYNARQQLLSIQDPRGNTTTNSYDAKGNLTTSTDAAGNVTSYAYDARGNRSSRTDALGGVVTYTYDARGNLTRERDALGNESSYTYDANGKRLTETRTRLLAGLPVSETVTNTYDKQGRLLSVTRPDGGTTRVTYNAAGWQDSSTDVLGRTTRFVYDAMGRVLETQYPDGTREAQTYDGEGRRLTFSDRAGRVTRYENDALGRLVKTTHPDGAIQSQTWDAEGRLASETDALGRTTTYQYNALGRRTSTTDPAGRVTQFTYDGNGNRLTTTDPLGRVTAYEYDALNRHTRTVFPDGSDERVVFDALGRKLAVIDAAGRATQYAYDAAGQLLRVTDALGQVTSYAYDERGNRVQQTDANGHTTSFAYDALGRPVRQTLPDGATRTATYDAAGNIVARSDYQGRVTNFTYDIEDRLTRRTTPDGAQVSFTYTPTGQRASVSDARGTTSYAYDARDRLVQLDYPEGSGLAYAYDPHGNRTALTAHVGAVSWATSYTYDAANRLATVIDAAGRVYTHGYDANGNRQSLAYPNGTVTSYGYDTRNRLIGLSTSGPTGTLQSYAYTLGLAGNRLAVTEGDGTQRAFGYDALYRLTSESVTRSGSPVFDNAFTYDPVGNRLTQARTRPSGTTTLGYVYDTRDRLVSEDGAPASYDPDGNLTAQAAGAYTWDYEHHLTRVTRADGLVVEHAYDADGRRLRTSVTPPGAGTEVRAFLVDPTGAVPQVVAESDGSGQVVAAYVRGDDLLAVVRPGGTRFFHADGLGSTRVLTDELGAVTDTYAYEAFGQLDAHVGSDVNAYLFAGQALDPNSGFYYNNARWFDPRVGRFTSADPFEGRTFDPPSLHKYLYGHGDPVDNTDPTGLYTLGSVLVTSAIIGSLSGALIGGIRGGVYGALKGFFIGLLLSPIAAFLGIGLGLGVAAIFGISASAGVAIVGGAVTAITAALNVYEILTASNERDRWAAGVSLIITVGTFGFGAYRYSNLPNTAPRTSPIPASREQVGLLFSETAAAYRGEIVVAREVTIQTSAARVRVDMVTRNLFGESTLIDAKFGPGARLTPNQTVGYPAFSVGGGTVRGANGIPAGWPAGTRLPAGQVRVDRWR